MRRMSGAGQRQRSSPHGLLEVPAQLPAIARMTQLAKRLRFDLANPLAGDPKLTAHFFECPESTVLESEAQDDDLALPLGELA